MRPRPLAFVSLLLTFAGSAAAGDLGRTGLAVLERDDAKLAAILRPALADPSPLVRAAAARVTNVRRATALLDDVRNALANESELRAAREEARALVMLGGTAELDRALAASARLDHRLDGSVAIAVARLGSDVAIAEWFSRLHALPHVFDGSNFFRLALWGHPALRSVVASRVLGANDARAFGAIANAGEAPLDPAIAVAAMSSNSDKIRSTAAASLLDAATAQQPFAVPAVATSLLDRPPDAGTSAAFAIELLRRIAKREPHEEPRFLDYVAHEKLDATLQPLLTAAEKKVFPRLPSANPLRNRIPMRPQGVVPPPFTAASHLPDGLGDAVLEEAHCRNGWIGNAKVSVDENGRVTDAGVADLAADARCRTAAEALLRLSLAENRRLDAPRSGFVLLAHARGAKLCTDEGEPLRTDSLGPLRAGRDHEVKPPVVTKRVEPRMPETARGDFLVVAESEITRSGCISDIALVTQSPVAALNAATILSVSQWEFAPATVDGEPVDVLFELSVRFHSSTTLMRR